jgi:ABC-type amino acid transport substrate-binding protein
VASLAANDSAAFIGNEAIAVERPTEFELSAAELPRLLNGIGHRLDSPLLDEAIRAGLRTMIGDGSYAAILERYGASSAALTEMP